MESEDHAVAVAALARGLLECRHPESVAALTVGAIADVTGLAAAFVDVHPDGRVYVTAAQGLEPGERLWLEETFANPRSLAERSFLVFSVPWVRAGVTSAVAVKAVKDVWAESTAGIEAIVHLVRAFAEHGTRVDALEESGARWRTIVEQFPDGTAELDANGRILSANPAFVQLCGGGPEVLGSRLQDVLQVAGSGATGQLEARVSTPEGERMLELRLTPAGARTLATIRSLGSGSYGVREADLSSGSAGRLLARLVRAVEDERSRMASEIHDGPVQSLSGVTLRLATVRDLLAGNRLAQADVVLASLCEQLAGEVSSLRRFMVDLRPPALDRLGLLEALAQHGERFERETGVRFVLRGSPGPRLPAARELVIYRIVQEALINVAKHAHAKTVVVTLEADAAGRGVLEIEDDGVGFPSAQTDRLPAGHFGIVSMRERAEMVGAELEVKSSPGAGATVQVLFRKGLRR